MHQLAEPARSPARTASSPMRVTYDPVASPPIRLSPDGALSPDDDGWEQARPPSRRYLTPPPQWPAVPSTSRSPKTPTPAVNTKALDRLAAYTAKSCFEQLTDEATMAAAAYYSVSHYAAHACATLSFDETQELAALINIAPQWIGLYGKECARDEEIGALPLGIRTRCFYRQCGEEQIFAKRFRPDTQVIFWGSQAWQPGRLTLPDFAACKTVLAQCHDALSSVRPTRGNPTLRLPEARLKYLPPCDERTTQTYRYTELRVSRDRLDIGHWQARGSRYSDRDVHCNSQPTTPQVEARQLESTLPALTSPTAADGSEARSLDIDEITFDMPFFLLVRAAGRLRYMAFINPTLVGGSS